MLIVTNFESFPARWKAASGEEGEGAAAFSLGEFLRRRRDDAVMVVSCDLRLTMQLAAVFLLLPFLRRPLISVDLVLRRPRRWWHRAALPLERFLLSRCDHHIHYFRDLRGYRELFGIGPGNSSFVPFKANLRHRFATEPSPGGDYVLCFGRSLRDFDTFFDAVEQLPYPAAIPTPDFARLGAHGSRFTRPLDRLPPNLRLVEDDGSMESLAGILKNARVVALPILPSSIAASGIGTCLNAMLMGKCVIGTEGPGMTDIFTDEILAVPPQDPTALAAAIRRAWEDDALRASVAAAGYRYALEAGGEPELYGRVIERVLAWSRGTAVKRA